MFAGQMFVLCPQRTNRIADARARMGWLMALMQESGSKHQVTLGALWAPSEMIPPRS